MRQVECAVCGEKLMFPGHGRWVDRSWTEDAYVRDEFQGKWICCFNCYRKTFRAGCSSEGSGK